MDLFALDKLVILFAKKLMSDPTFQFATLVGLWVVSEAVLPSKKKKEQSK